MNRRSFLGMVGVVSAALTIAPLDGSALARAVTDETVTGRRPWFELVGGFDGEFIINAEVFLVDGTRHTRSACVTIKRGQVVQLVDLAGCVRFKNKGGGHGERKYVCENDTVQICPEDDNNRVRDRYEDWGYTDVSTRRQWGSADPDRRNENPSAKRTLIARLPDGGAR
jgi:hypothetical protein